MKNNVKKEFLINFSYVLVILLIFYFSVKFLFFYLLPFLIAIPVAIFTQKYADYISRKIKLKRGIIAAVLAATIYIVLVIVTAFIIYKTSVFASNLIKNFSFGNVTELIYKMEENLNRTLKNLAPQFWKQISNFLSVTLENFSVKASNYISNFATNTAKKIPSFIFSSVVTLVATCFIAKDYESLKKFTSYLCGERAFSNFVKIKNILFSSVLKIIKGYFFLMFLTFLELLIGFFILGIKNPFTLALLIAFIDILPILGIGIVLVPWCIICFFTNQISLGVSLLIIYLIIALVRNFAEPKIIGTQIGIHPLFTLLAMFIGVKVFGFAGLFILPITLIVTVKYYKSEMEEENVFKTAIDNK